MSKKKIDLFEARRNVRLEEELRIEKALREDAEARLQVARTPPPVVVAPVAPPPPPPLTLRQQRDAIKATGDLFALHQFQVQHHAGLLHELTAPPSVQAAPVATSAPVAPAAAPTAPPPPAPPSIRDQLNAIPESNGVARRLFVLANAHALAAEGDAAIRGGN